MRLPSRRLIARAGLGGALALALSISVALADTGGSSGTLTSQCATQSNANGVATPPAAATGLGSLLPACAAVHPKAVLISERYSMISYFPLGDPGWKGPGAVDCGNPLSWIVHAGDCIKQNATAAANVFNPALYVDAALTQLASMILMATMAIGLLVGRLVEWTFTMNIAGSAGDVVTKVVGTMSAHLYQPLLPGVLSLVGIWLLHVGVIRRRASQGFEGVAWVVLALTVSGAYMAAPTAIMNGINDLTAGISIEVLGLTASADPKVNDSTIQVPGDNGETEIRIFADRFWNDFVYIPWTVAEFGQTDPIEGHSCSTPHPDDPKGGCALAVELLDKQQGTTSQFDADLALKSNQSIQNWYVGTNEGPARLAIAGVAFLTVVFAALLYLIIALAVIMSQLALLILMLLAPIFFLLGIHPGGRRVMIRWLELVAGVLFVRIVYAVLLGVMTVLSGIITTQVAQVNWALAAALQMALVIAVLIYRKPFMAVFSQVASPRAVMARVRSPEVSQMASGAVDRISGWADRMTTPRRAAAPSPRPGTTTIRAATPVAGPPAAASPAATSATTGVGTAASSVAATTGSGATAGSAAAGSAGTASAAGSSGAAAAGGAATGGALLIAYGAVKAGQTAVSTKRRMQEQAMRLALDGGPGMSMPASNQSGAPLSRSDIRSRQAERAAYSQLRQRQRLQARGATTRTPPSKGGR